MGMDKQDMGKVLDIAAMNPKNKRSA